MTADEGFVTERWVYLGERTNEKGLLNREAWTSESDPDHVHLYDKARGSQHAVGYIYLVRVKRADGSVWRKGQPEWTGDRAPHEVTQRATLQAQAARAQAARVAQEKKAVTAPDAIDEAMEPLMKLAGMCRTKAERDALYATVLRRLGLSW